MFLHYLLPGLLTANCAYLLGSISFAIIVTKKFASVDVRTVGSGNAGATNVLRAAGKKASALVFLLDFLKCVAAMFLGAFLFNLFSKIGEPVAFADAVRYYGMGIGGICCLAGHVYPIYFQFKGGKGMVTCAAMIAMFDWRVIIVGIILFTIILLIGKRVSVASVGSMLFYPVVTFLFTYFLDYKHGFLCRFESIPFAFVVTSTVFASFLSLIIILTHIPNIKRLLKGEESKINFKS